jgi:hypothetical protein
MAVFMGFGPMARMVVIVGAVVSGVIVVMDFAAGGVAVLMAVFVTVLVVMGMGVFVAVFASIVGMFVGVSMGMLVAM